jgi:hypothetical protein
MDKIAGFAAQRQPDKTPPEVVIQNLDAEFQAMISVIDKDELLKTRGIALDERIRKEVVKLHKRVQALEVNVRERERLMAQVEGMKDEYPDKSMAILPLVEELDRKIEPESVALFKEMDKHMIPDVAELYKDIDLSNEQKKHIRALVGTLSVTLHNLVGSVGQSIRKGETGLIRKQLEVNK